MPESYSVKAILSAADKGFTSAMKSAANYANNLKTELTGGLGFGIMAAAGAKAFDSVSSGISGLVSELNSSSAAWKTFTGNMEMNGKTAGEIKSIKNELQDFATQTIYSSSDMATTFAQLEAVGTKNTTKLVKGFGGLAAAAENPAQAMKTLNQQAVQMAAKPKVAWEDFKLMLEQTPAGISAIAKEMGMSTSEMVKNVQDGKIATEDFFDAISKVGTNKAFTDLATQYKTVGQAMDGLTETASNKLAPAFDVLSDKGISAISALTDKMGELDGEAIAGKLESFIGKASGYWNVLKETAIDVGGAFGDAFGSIAKEVGNLTGSFGSTESIDNFGSALNVAGGYAKSFAGFLEDNAEPIAKLITELPKLLVAYKGFKIVSTIAPGVKSFTGAILGLAGKGISGIASKLLGISVGQKAVGEASALSAKNTLAMAAAIVALGAGVALASAGLYLLANSAVMLAEAGAPAVAIMVGLVAAIAGLAVGASVIGPALTAGAVGMVAFGAAIALVGAGALMASAGLALVSSALPTISEYGAQGALSIAALGVSMLAFAAGAAAAGAASLVLGAGLLVVGAAVVVAAAGVLALAAGSVVLGAGLAITAGSATLLAAALPSIASGAATSSVSLTAMLVSATALSAIMLILSASIVAFGLGATAATVGIAAFGIGMAAATVGVAAMEVALLAVNSSMKSISKNAKSAKSSISSMKNSLSVVNEGLDALGSKAKSAINSFISSFSSAESKAKTAGKNIGNNINSGVKSGLDKLPSTANSAMSKFNSGISSGGNRAVSTARSISSSITSALRSAGNSAYSSGVYIGQGLANGMRSQLANVRSIASQLAAQAEKAIRAKAQIRSPSRVTEKLGEYWGQGYVNGILSMAKEAVSASRKLVFFPELQSDGLSLSLAGTGMTISDDSVFGDNSTYVIEVPINLDGREVSRVTAPFMRKDLDKIDSRNNRKHGIR